MKLASFFCLLFLNPSCLISGNYGESILYLNEKHRIVVQNIKSGISNKIEDLSDSNITRFKYSEGLLGYFKIKELRKPLALYSDNETEHLEFGSIRKLGNKVAFNKMKLPSLLDKVQITNFFFIPQTNEVLFEFSDSSYTKSYHVLYDFLKKESKNIAINDEILNVLFQKENHLYLQTSKNHLLNYNLINEEVSEVKNLENIEFLGENNKIDFSLTNLWDANQVRYFDTPNIFYNFSAENKIKVSIKTVSADTLVDTLQVRFLYNILVLSTKRDGLSRTIYNPLNYERLSSAEDLFILSKEPNINLQALNNTGDLIFSVYNENIGSGKLFLYDFENDSLKELDSSFRNQSEFYLL